jgi:hypothetical protein
MADGETATAAYTIGWEPQPGDFDELASPEPPPPA